MPLRILCLGAYANGNVGDMYQAEAVAAAIKAVRPEAEIVSVSPSKRQSTYPARNHLAGPIDGAFDLDYINSFDTLVVGGGGLLSAPHRPLTEEDWVAGLTLPVVALAVGAANGAIAESASFVRKCHSFSVRDEFSRNAIGDLRPDIDIVMDPILLTPMTRPEPVAKRHGILWVPGRIVPGTVASYEDLFNRLYEPSSDAIVSFNPETDKRSGGGFDNAFGGDVEYLASAERFVELAASKRFVVSERYHGCILALNSGLPCVGLALRSETVTSKITELYRKLGFPKCVSSLNGTVTRRGLSKLAEGLDFGAIDADLATARTAMHAYLDRALPK